MKIGKWMRVLFVLLALAVTGAFVVEEAMARGGRGRGRGRGRMGRGGRGGGDTEATPKEALASRLEKRVAEAKEDATANAREVSTNEAVSGLYARIRITDREREARARRADWRVRANPR